MSTDILYTQLLSAIYSEDNNAPIETCTIGIKRFQYPVTIRKRSGNKLRSVATIDCSIGVSILDDKARLNIMPQLSEFFSNFNHDLTQVSPGNLASQIITITGTNHCELQFSFPYFINKCAPVSHMRSLLSYRVTLSAHILNNNIAITGTKVLVPVKSLCPCSKKISNHGAHTQRSYITIMTMTSEHIWVEDLIDYAEYCASADLYSVLKREDEKYITERAYNNPKFVEDLVRDITRLVATDPRIDSCFISAESIESIHNHSAYASLKYHRN